jgi:hypothetical protein
MTRAPWRWPARLPTTPSPPRPGPGYGYLSDPRERSHLLGHPANRAHTLGWAIEQDLRARGELPPQPPAEAGRPRPPRRRVR